MNKIYKIINEDGRIYIGSTSQKLNIRFNSHKSKNKKGINRCALKVFNMNTATIELLEDLGGLDKKQVLLKEREYIENTICINKDRPIVTAEERKIKFKEAQTKWLEEKGRIIINCECGLTYQTREKSRHFKSEKHIKYSKK